MLPQDIRIIQFKNFSPFKKQPRVCDAMHQDVPAFSYFDRILVSPLKQDASSPDTAAVDTTLFDKAYQNIQNMFRRSYGDYQSQQIIIAFSDVKSDLDQKRIDAFWERDDNALFFVTMVNVTLESSLDDTVTRINNIYGAEENYLIYYTLEHSEIIIFYKGNTFKDYSKRVMRLNYEKRPEAPSHIMDTITICGFGKRGRSTDEDSFDVCLRMDVTDYAQAKSFLDNYIDDHKRIPKRKWLLGRNDIALWLPSTTLEDLYSLYAAYEGCWITTLEMLILIDPDAEVESYLEEKEALANRGPSQTLTWRKENLTEKIQQLEQTYEDVCKMTGSEKDNVIVRILYDINALIFDVDNAQLAEDLVVGLLPQIEDFVNYIIKVCNIITSGKPVKENVSYLLQLCWNTFYLNITALINNTVHSDRKFVQIPHYEAASFEMPSKMMAYYSLVTHDIAAVLNDRPDDVYYGIMLSPKLVDELEVEPFALHDVGEPHQIISINISEKMMYQPKRTVAILGHEIAHFVSDAPRSREDRLQQILGYYIDYILQKLSSVYAELLPLCGENTETLDRYFTIEERREFCLRQAKSLMEEIKSTPRFEADAESEERTEGTAESPTFYIRDVERELELLPKRLFNNNERRNEIFRNFIFPEDSRKDPLYLRSILRKLRLQTGFPQDDLKEDMSLSKMPAVVQAQVKCYAKAQFLYTLERFPLSWNCEEVIGEFHKNTGYLFSEAYADIAMLILFNMEAPDYAKLFVEGEKDDRLEKMRFIAVVRTMKNEGMWNENSINGKESDQSGWGREVTALLEASLSEDGNRLKETLQMKQLDALLISYLVSYLACCVKKLRDLVEQNYMIVSSLRATYDAVDLNRSAKESLAAIMKREARLFKDAEES